MSVEEETIRQQILLEGYKDQEAEEIYLLVAALLLKGFIDDINSLGVPKVKELPWTRVQRFIKRLQANQSKIAGGGLRQLIKDLKGLSSEEVDFMREALEEGPVSDRQAWANAEDTPLSGDGSTLERFLPFWIAAHSTRMGNLIRRGWADSIPTQDLISLVRGTRARKYKDGLLRGPLLRDIRYVVSNAAQHVSSTAKLFVMQRSSKVKGYRWRSVLDSRTSAICRSLDGREFKFGEGPRPPIHPNCRSTIVPVLIDPPGGTATRPAEGGPVRADTTYYAWLKRQPKGFQEEVLGKTRAKLFREGGMSAQQFADLNLNRKFKPRTLDEMRRLRPVVFDRAGVEV